MPEFILKTFGCKTNQYESEGIREALTQKGWTETDNPAAAAAGIINTCTVTSRAGASARNAIRKLLKQNPELKIIITGCAVDVSDNWLSKLNISKIFRNTEKHQIAKYLSGSEQNGDTGTGFEFSINNFEGHTRAFLKIHDGCDNFCSYCIIPYARGIPRSRDYEDIIHEAKTLSANGYSELVLTGINIGAYQTETATLPSLLRSLSSIPEITRIRLGSIEPIYLTEDLLKTIRDDEKVCAHLHLPLQSGSNPILKAMNRKYTKDDFLKCVEQSRSILDNPAITTDIIVGFPTEDEKNYRETVCTIEEIGFARSHIFLFSPREGTPAFDMKRPPQREAYQRRLELEELTSRQARDYSSSLIGISGESLMVEKITGGKAHGYLERYIRAELDIGDSKYIIKSGLYPVKVAEVKDIASGNERDRENVVLCSI